MGKKAIILSIGDELVLGQTVDTNSAWLSQQLATVGVDVLAHMTVADVQHAIEDAIHESAQRCDYLICSGGIGPTEDDLTRQALAVVLGVPLEMNSTWLKKLDDFFLALGRPMPEMNKIQAMIPRGATMIDNGCGTASGIDAVIRKLGVGVHGSVHATNIQPATTASAVLSPPASLNPDPRTQNPEPQTLSRACRVFCTPGVPKEMKAMFVRDVLPHLQTDSSGAIILSRTLHTFGVGESTIAERLGELMKRGRNPSVGTTVAGGIVSVRINARFDGLEKCRAELETTSAACRAALGDLIFGEDGQTLPQMIAKLIKRQGGDPQTDSDKSTPSYTIATAESCTGGLLAKMLTDEPGSSHHFTTGFVTYSNQAKYDRLGVNQEMLNVYGAVSEQVVDAMSRATRRLAKANFALAVSGVAGPDGGSITKPVGTVCIALAYEKKHADGVKSKDWRDNTETLLRTFCFPGDRDMVRDRSAKMALTLLRYHLMGQPIPF